MIVVAAVSYALGVAPADAAAAASDAATRFRAAWSVSAARWTRRASLARKAPTSPGARAHAPSAAGAARPPAAGAAPRPRQRPQPPRQRHPRQRPHLRRHPPHRPQPRRQHPQRPAPLRHRPRRPQALGHPPPPPRFGVIVRVVFRVDSRVHRHREAERLGKVGAGASACRLAGVADIREQVLLARLDAHIDEERVPSLLEVRGLEDGADNDQSCPGRSKKWPPSSSRGHDGPSTRLQSSFTNDVSGRSSSRVALTESIWRQAEHTSGLPGLRSFCTAFSKSLISDLDNSRRRFSERGLPFACPAPGTG